MEETEIKNKTHYNDKLTKEDIEKIKELRKSGILIKTIAEQYKVSGPCIWYHTLTNEEKAEIRMKKAEHKRNKKQTNETDYIENKDEAARLRRNRYARKYYNKKHHKKNKPTPKENISYGGYAKEAIRKHKIHIYNQLYKINQLTTGMDLFGTGDGYFNLIKNTKALVITIDCNPEIAETLSKIPNGRYAPIQTICKEDRKFNILDLDYCGDLRESQENDISAIPNIMMNEGILWLTLCMRTGSFAKDTSRACMESFYEYRIIQLLKEQGIYAKRSFTVKYQGKTTDITTEQEKKETPMKFYEFNWRKIKPGEKWTEDISPTPELITIEEMEEIDESNKSTIVKIINKTKKNSIINNIIKTLKSII